MFLSVFVRVRACVCVCSACLRASASDRVPYGGTQWRGEDIPVAGSWITLINNSDNNFHVSSILDTQHASPCL